MVYLATVPAALPNCLTQLPLLPHRGISPVSLNYHTCLTQVLHNNKVTLFHVSNLCIQLLISFLSISSWFSYPAGAEYIWQGWQLHWWRLTLCHTLPVRTGPARPPGAQVCHSGISLLKMLMLRTLLAATPTRWCYRLSNINLTFKKCHRTRR